MSHRVRRFAEPAELAEAAAALFQAAAVAAAAARGEFLAILPGGSTPKVLYRTLRERWAASIPWQACQLFFSDERCVPPEHPASNRGMAARELLAHVPVPPGQVHPAPVGAGTPAEVAAAWEAALRAFFGARGAASPRFDLAVLGVGADGHTASLFPGDPALDAGDRWTAAVAPRGAPQLPRVTLTLPALNAAARALFLAAGPDKERVIDAIETRAAAGSALPAARIDPPGGALWLYSEAPL
ncbi:MAG: 6-phosphogluconolactonase [Pseudomonadota bacterium]